MVNSLLHTIKDIPTDELESTAVDSHNLCEGYYFILHDNEKLEGPYLVTKKETIMPLDKQEWFRTRDFFSLWLNNDANKALSANAKNWLSCVPMMLGFKKGKVDAIKETETSVIKAVKDMDIACNNMPESMNLMDGEMQDYDSMVKRLMGSMDKALGMLAEREIEVKDTVRIKIFCNFSRDEYIRSGKKYLYCSLFNKDTASVVDGRTLGPSTFFLSANAKKAHIAPREMGYSAPFQVSLEDAYRLYMYYKILCSRQEYGVVYIPYNNSNLTGIGNNENTKGYRLTIEKGAIAEFSANERPERNNDYFISNYACLQELPQLRISAAIKRYILGLPPKKDADESIGEGYFIPKDCKVKPLIPTFEYGINEYIRTGIMPETVKRYLWQQVLQMSGGKTVRYAVNTWLNLKYNGRSICMRDAFTINDDSDYFYSAGQLAYFLTSLSSSKITKQKEIRQWMHITNDKNLKGKLRITLSKYANDCPNTKEVHSMIAMVFGYEPKEFCADSFVEGYFSQNAIWNSLVKDKKEEQNNEDAE